MPKSRPQPPRPDRRRLIRGSFSWIDHRFLREGFDEGLTCLEKLLYFVLVAVSNQDGVSFYSDARLAELLDIRFLRARTRKKRNAECIVTRSCAAGSRVSQFLAERSADFPDDTPPHNRDAFVGPNT
jgi:hypothetical protein